MFKRKKQLRRLYNGLPLFPDKYGYEAFSVLAVYILGGLKAYRACGNSYAPDFDSYEDWIAAVDKMIWSFDQIANECPDDPNTIHFYEKWKEAEKKDVPLLDCDEHGRVSFSDMLNDGRPTKEEEAAYHARVQEGLDLFAKYFRDLWD